MIRHRCTRSESHGVGKSHRAVVGKTSLLPKQPRGWPPTEKVLPSADQTETQRASQAGNLFFQLLARSEGVVGRMHTHLETLLYKIFDDRANMGMLEIVATVPVRSSGRLPIKSGIEAAI